MFRDHPSAILFLLLPLLTACSAKAPRPVILLDSPLVLPQDPVKPSTDESGSAGDVDETPQDPDQDHVTRQFKAKAVVDPGWFDIGAGYGFLKDTRPGPDNDANGLMLSFKAYPAGRWYGTSKKKKGGSYEKGIFQVQEANFFQRFSVYYGFSPSHYSGGGVDSTVHSLGIGFDVSPQFAILVGGGMFDALGKSKSGKPTTNADMAWFFGVSLNLNAFQEFLGAATGLRN